MSLQQRLAYFLVVAVTIAVVPVTSMAACLNSDEHRAFSVRSLQTELMVAALSCRQENYRDDYNRFVRKFTKGMVAHGGVFKQAFQRHYGASARHYLDRYLTALANRLSSRSMTEPNFCDQSGQLFEAVLHLDRRQLGDFSLSRELVVSDLQACPEVAQKPDGR